MLNKGTSLPYASLLHSFRFFLHIYRGLLLVIDETNLPYQQHSAERMLSRLCCTFNNKIYVVIFNEIMVSNNRIFDNKQSMSFFELIGEAFSPGTVGKIEFNDRFKNPRDKYLLLKFLTCLAILLFIEYSIVQHLQKTNSWADFI